MHVLMCDMLFGYLQVSGRPRQSNLKLSNLFFSFLQGLNRHRLFLMFVLTICRKPFLTSLTFLQSLTAFVLVGLFVAAFDCNPGCLGTVGTHCGMVIRVSYYNQPL